MHARVRTLDFAKYKCALNNIINAITTTVADKNIAIHPEVNVAQKYPRQYVAFTKSNKHVQALQMAFAKPEKWP